MTNERDLLIWLAGFFDGEGCVGIRRQKNTWYAKRSSKKQHWTYDLYVAVSQKHQEPLQRFKDTFGGHLYRYELHGVPYWRWCGGGRIARPMLERLLPYLLVKRAIAELGLRYHEEMSGWNKLYGRVGYPDHVEVIRHSFYLQARELNAKNRTNNNAPKYVGPAQLKAVNGEG